MTNHPTTRRHTSFRSLAAGFGLCLAACGGAAAHAQPIYHLGHGDIGVAYEDGMLELHYHFESNSMAEGGELIADSEYSPQDAFTRVPDPAIPRPAGAQWNFTGATTGSPLWFLPQTSDPNKPLFGFASEELNPSDWLGPITFSLTNVVSAPAGGEFSLWQTNLFGEPTRYWDSFDGDFTNDVFDLAIGGHDDASFGFTAPGVYQLEITATGQHATDGMVTGSGIFTFLVGNDTLPPATAVPEPSGVAATLMAVLGALLGAGLLRRKPR